MDAFFFSPNLVPMVDFFLRDVNFIFILLE